MRSLNIEADGWAIADNGTQIGRVEVTPRRTLLWEQDGTRIEADTCEGMAFELSCRYTCCVSLSPWWRITQ